MPSHIFHINNIKELLTSRHIQFNSIVYWDLDNTVFQPTKELGSDQWFENFYALSKSKLNASFQLALMIETYNAIQAHVDVTHVEPKTIQIIQRLNTIGIPQVFLTARNAKLAAITVRQLEQVGIKASEYPIIFCDGRDKGEMLVKSLQEKPAHIIMIDDKSKNIQHIEKAAAQRDIPFSGFVYNFLLEKVSQFDIGFSHFQLSCLQHKLPLQVQNFIDALELTWEPKHEEQDSPRSKY